MSEKTNSDCELNVIEKGEQILDNNDNNTTKYINNSVCACVRACVPCVRVSVRVIIERDKIGMVETIYLSAGYNIL